MFKIFFLYAYNAKPLNNPSLTWTFSATINTYFTNDLLNFIWILCYMDHHNFGMSQESKKTLQINDTANPLARQNPLHSTEIFSYTAG